MMLRSSETTASVVHTDDREAKSIKKIYGGRRSSTTLCFPKTAQLQRKMRVGSMCQYGAKTALKFTKLLRHKLVILCCPNIPSRTIVQQQNVPDISTGFKILPSDPWLLASPELYPMGITAMMAWKGPTCHLPDNPNLETCLVLQSTVHPSYLYLHHLLATMFHAVSTRTISTS